VVDNFDGFAGHGDLHVARLLRLAGGHVFRWQQIIAVTFTFGFSSAMARMAPIMVAAPAMVVLSFFSMPSAGFIENAAGVEGHALPTRTEMNFIHRATGS